MKKIFFLTLLFLTSFPTPTSAAFKMSAPLATANSGLVGHWTLDKRDINFTSGVVTDRSGRGNDGALGGSISASALATGKLAQGLTFDGVDDYINVGSSASLKLTSWTISAWIKRDSLTSSGNIVLKVAVAGDPNSDNYDLSLGSNGLLTARYENTAGTNTDIATTDPISDLNWHHVVYAFNDTTNDERIYIDGVSAANQSNSLVPETADASSVYIGRNVVNSSFPFKGAIDDVRIYNRALTAAEINTIYRQRSAPIAAASLVTAKLGLIGHWTLDKRDVNFTGGTVIDRSGSGTTGTMNGSIAASALTGGKVAQGLRFDGSNDDIELTDISHTPANARSWGAWFQIAGTSGGSHHGIISHYSGTNGYQILVTDDTFTLVCGVGDGGHQNPSAYTVALNTWYHVMCTADGTTLRQYVNGVETATVAAGSIGDPTNVLRIGNGSDVTTRYLNGIIDDVRIYNRTLSAAEVKTIYKQRSVITANASQSPGGLASGLVGHWTMDGKHVNWGTGVVTDASGSGNNGAMRGSISTSTSPVIGKIGQALKFDGINDYIQLSDAYIPTSGNFAVSLWFRANNTTANTVLFGQYDSLVEPNIGRFFLEVNRTAGKAGFFHGSGAGAVAATNGFTVGNWQHLAITRTGSTFQLYVNGVADASGSSAVGIQDANSAIARANGAISDYFSGAIDDVRVYNRTLSATEIKALYSMGR